MAKIKVMATVQWELEIPEHETNLSKVAKATLESILPGNFEVQVLRTTRPKKSNRLEMLGEFGLEEVFSLLSSTDERVEFKIKDKSYLVRMDSHRYFVFRHNHVCAACGLEGTKFILEQHPSDKSPHFNLYAVEDGNLVLMTKDHILAKAFGGEDRHSNYQTMCSICNNLKGSGHFTLAGIAELRKLFNDNKDTLAKKKLNTLLNEARKRLMVPRFSVEDYLPVKGIRLKIDINILRKEDGTLVALPVYNVPEQGKGMVAVASMKKGWLIKPESIQNKRMTLRFDDKQVFELHQGLTDFEEKSASQSDKSGV